MTTLHRPTRIAAATATGLLLAGCGTVTQTGSDDTATAAGYPVETTSCERSVEVTQPPERVVSLHPSLTEVLVRLGVADRVVAQAQDGTGTPPPEVADEVAAIPSLSSDTPPDKETLVNERPDLVLSGTEYEFNTEMGFAGYDDLEGLGIPAYVATAGCQSQRMAGSVEDAFTDLAFLGRVFGAETEATALEEEMRDRLAAVEERTSDLEPVRAAQVFVEAGKLYAIGGAVEVDILRLAGGSNVFDADDALFGDFFAAEVNPEVVVDADPEAFVFAVTDEEHERTTRAYLERTFPSSTAVEESRLVAIDNSYVQPGTLGAVEGVEVVADGLHE
jgi:iron complex transport system substrate-binding protein